MWSESEIAARLDDTVSAWQSWSELHQAYVGPWRDLVHHSGRVLQALSFQPTGAICAAATTSLPEVVGGARNWDYRYAWVRDASFTIEALWVAACPDEANQFFDSMTAFAAGSLEQAGDLQIMFGIGGERDLTERELPHLAGWRQSAPVRIGNGAWRQRQLDVYGELLSAVHRLSDRLFDPMARRVGPWPRPTGGARRPSWRRRPGGSSSTWPTPRPGAGEEKDHGIWEVRGEPRHFVYSKLMCWVALDRATAMADRSARPTGSRRGRTPKAEIRQAILGEGWSDRVDAFTQSFGSDELDASNLMLPLVGFLPADDPRVLSTIEATEDRLTDPRGLVYRYRARDGLDGEEGTFLLCTFWLAQALARSGQARAGAHRVRTRRRVRQRRRPARGRGRPEQRRALGQLPAGLQPHRPGQRGVGDLRSRGGWTRHAVTVRGEEGVPGESVPYELLAAVDVVGRTGERRVGHEVDGQGGDVRRSDDAPDRQRRRAAARGARQARRRGALRTAACRRSRPRSSSRGWARSRVRGS